jgi:hypothetical protein
MIWQGLSDGQLCRSIKDPKQNKNRNLDQLVEHLTEDKLVAWGWNPGEGRDPIPMSHDEFAAKVKKWRSAGAPCPTDTGPRAAVAPQTEDMQNGFTQQQTIGGDPESIPSPGDSISRFVERAIPGLLLDDGQSGS